MATARRGGPDAADAGRVPLVHRIGVLEVDRIIDGCKFRNFPNHSLLTPKATTTTVSKVRRITDGHKFRKLSARATSKDKEAHISRMPDDILRFIISRLPMREAAATSVLSTQWRNLWTTSLPCLNFDIPNMVGHDYPNTIFENQDENYVQSQVSNFTKWVDHVMQSCLASSLDALRISFILNTDVASDIDRWITSSVARGVSDIHLDFHFEKFYGFLHEPSKQYEFPVQLVASTIRYLYLKFCKLSLPPGFTGFTSLVSLTLIGVTLTQLLVDDILSKSPLLEFLSLDHFDYLNGESIEITGPSLKLKHLHIGSSFDVIDTMEVHHINLLSFELRMCIEKITIKDTPHLARLVLFMTTPVEIVGNTSRLETLFILQESEEEKIVPQSHVLNNLKRLVFIANYTTTDLLGVVHILKDCHLLQKLELDMGLVYGHDRWLTKPVETLNKLDVLPGMALNNLKEIEIYGFQAYPEKVALAKYLLKNAIVLQKMKIYTILKVYRGNGRWTPSEDTKKQAKALERVCTELRDVARSSTKIELFSSLNL